MEVAAEEAFRSAAALRMGALQRLAFGLCGDRHLAEDLVQTALVRLYVAWPLRSPATVDAWLRQTLVRAWIDTTRRPWWRREQSTAELPETAAPSGDGVDGSLLSMLAFLPPRQRACIVLRHLDDLSVEQAAAVLGCSTGTVKSSTSRGLATLRLHLHEEHHA